MSEAQRNEYPVDRLVGKDGAAYYFSHETIKRYENGEIKFVDKDGTALHPIYFGAGLSGMNGVLRSS